MSCSGSGSVGPQGCGTTQSYSQGASVTLTATPGSGWQFNGWSGACPVTGSCTLTLTANTSVTAIFTQVQPTLTLYVHEGSATGPVLAGVQVTGQEGAGNAFNQTTNASGYVTLTGVPGTWSFTASKAGYQTNTWSQSITATDRKDAFLLLTQAPTPAPSVPDISGRWSYPEGFIDFVRISADTYRFVDFNVFGVPVSEGTATQFGYTLVLKGKNVLAGSFSAELGIRSDSLEMKGTLLNAFGNPAGYLFLSRLSR